MSNASKVEAVRDLLGVQDPSNPPSEMTLPEYVHLRMLHAVDETVSDGHERSINFRFRGGIWLGGTALKGTGSRISRWDILPTLFLNAELRAHTHPAGTEIMNQSLEWVGKPPDWLSEEEVRLFHHLPSPHDVGNTVLNHGRSAAKLIAAAGGMFISVRKDPENTEKRANWFNSGLAEAIYMKVDHEAQRIAEEIKLATTAEQILEILLRERLKLLKPRYACYVTDDVENPLMERVE